MTTNQQILELVSEAYAHLRTAQMQTIESDDQIIANHVRDAETLLRAALRVLSAQTNDTARR
jgi:hypothetical protein